MSASKSKKVITVVAAMVLGAASAAGSIGPMKAITADAGSIGPMKAQPTTNAGSLGIMKVAGN